MMKLLLSIVGAFLVSTVPVSSQQTEQFFCGTGECIIPLRLSCEQMIEEYEFQGSCCSMESIPETRGCRVRVANRGNCFWYPYCGLCDMSDEEIGCNTVYTTESDNSCPDSEFDPLFQNTTNQNMNRTRPSCVPTMAPSEPEVPTAAPLSGGTYHNLGYLISIAIVAVGLVLSW
mmetsp:Transcript_13581/g.21849  ORF Transcript_13581/g.21849 Transcript_13581/m.21849 type:complete len:174 (-) Transcript_13581:947-1468(-)